MLKVLTEEELKKRYTQYRKNQEMAKVNKARERQATTYIHKDRAVDESALQARYEYDQVKAYGRKLDREVWEQEYDAHMIATGRKPKYGRE